MPKLDATWIEQQLAICKAESDTRQVFGALPHPYKHPVHYAFLSAVREGYPLVLRELQDFYTSFALYSKAMQAATELYLKAHPELGELLLPDTGKVVAWLVAQIQEEAINASTE